MNRSDDLEALMQAGVTSFKIEGRLKNASYVKNITAFYRQKIDKMLADNPVGYRPSAGRSSFAFEPCPEKSFNRGFTSYFLHGRNAAITAFDTPKSVGEPVAVVKELKANSLTVDALKPLHNGDGLIFFNSQGEQDGFRVNRVEANRIYPQEMPSITHDTLLYRNYDHAFESLLAKPSAERKIGVTAVWSDYPDGFILTLTDETAASVAIARPFAKEIAHKPQDDNIRTQLNKFGNTPFETVDIVITDTAKPFFVPSSLLSDMRRKAIEQLLSVRSIRYRRLYAPKATYNSDASYPEQTLDYTANVYNLKAAAFYRHHGVATISPAFEQEPVADAPLMYAKHCLRYALGRCPEYHQRNNREPYYLVYQDKRLRLSFDCQKCQMLVYNSI
jgi:putative protease